MQAVDHEHEEQSPEDIEQNVAPGNLLCLFIGAELADHDGHTLSEIYTDHNGNGDRIRNGTRNGKRLQDTHGGIRTLDHSRHHKTDGQTQKGILKGFEHGPELFALPKGFEHLLHQCHSIEKHAETYDDAGRFLHFFLFGKQSDKCTDPYKQRCKRRGFQKQKPEVVGTQISETQDLRCRRTADI